jgi:hypothetical protein
MPAADAAAYPCRVVEQSKPGEAADTGAVEMVAPVGLGELSGGRTVREHIAGLVEPKPRKVR